MAPQRLISAFDPNPALTTDKQKISEANEQLSSSIGSSRLHGNCRVAGNFQLKG
jgi:hypothetical protein